MATRNTRGPLQNHINNSVSYQGNVYNNRAFMLDMWYHYPNYGFLNDRYEPIIPNVGENNENLVTFGDYAQPGQMVLPFVQKAFNDFRTKYFERIEASGEAQPKFIEGMLPKKSYESFEQKYSEYIFGVLNKYREISFQSRKHLLDEVLENIQTFPISKSGFVLSNKCPISVTGLSVELAKLAYSSIPTKEELLRSKPYRCFLEDVTSSGFYVDGNAPWRLIANLESEKMQEYIQAYKEGTTTENILDRFFRGKTHYDDIPSIYSFFNNLNYPLTTSELLSYTLQIRMKEVGMDMHHYEMINKQVQDIFFLYSGNYPNDPLHGAASIIGKYCSEKLKQTYEKRLELNGTGVGIQIKDYM